MTKPFLRPLLPWLAAAAIAAPAQAQSPKPQEAAKSPPPAAIQYEPPRRGAPKGRIGGGTRGPEAREITLAVIAPDHAGLSTKPSPRLYWFLSPATAGAAFEASVIEDGAVDAVLDKPIAAPSASGIQVLDLEALGVRLQPGKEYRWFVSLVAKPGARSSDVVASGKVIFEAPPTELAARVASAAPMARPGIYAAAGYWYDAYDGMRQVRSAAPTDAGLRQAEVSLLTQAGLPQVAGYVNTP
jgi:hypothetical protein